MPRPGRARRSCRRPSRTGIPSSLACLSHAGARHPSGPRRGYAWRVRARRAVSPAGDGQDGRRPLQRSMQIAPWASRFAISAALGHPTTGRSPLRHTDRAAVQSRGPASARLEHDRLDYNVNFGPTQVAMQATYAHAVLGEPGKALKAAEGVHREDLRPISLWRAPGSMSPRPRPTTGGGVPSAPCCRPGTWHPLGSGQFQAASTLPALPGQ